MQCGGSPSKWGFSWFLLHSVVAIFSCRKSSELSLCAFACLGSVSCFGRNRSNNSNSNGKTVSTAKCTCFHSSLRNAKWKYIEKKKRFAALKRQKCRFQCHPDEWRSRAPVNENGINSTALKRNERNNSNEISSNVYDGMQLHPTKRKCPFGRVCVRWTSVRLRPVEISLTAIEPVGLRTAESPFHWLGTLSSARQTRARRQISRQIYLHFRIENDLRINLGPFRV